MIAFTLSSLLVGTLLICLFALQRRLRIYRFERTQRQFLSRFSHLEAPARERVLALAESRGRGPSCAPAGFPEERLVELLRMRWQAMREAREFDFPRLRQDLERLLEA